MENRTVDPTSAEAEKYLPVVQRADAISLKVWTEDDFQDACSLVVKLKDGIKAWEDFMEPARQANYRAYQTTLDTINKIKLPMKRALDGLLPLCKRFKIEHEANRKAEEERLNAEYRKQQETQILEHAVSLEDQGEHSQAAAFISAPVPMPPPVLQKLAKVEGLSDVKKWTFEITDKAALVKYLLETNKIHLIEFDEKALKDMARVLKGVFDWPGIRAVEDFTFARTGR